MIEMSVDKEPAGPGASGPQDQPHRRAQPQGECAGDCSSAPRPQGGAAATTTAAAAHAGTEPAERPGRDCGATRPKNGLQQQQQQQKAFKRRNSVNVGFKHPGFSKRRRRANSESDPVLPTNFLLGGNIFDPLNLNSLLDEEVNRALNAETPKSSPLPAKSRDPVEILIPKDITDPLNLNCAGGETGLLVSPMKTGGGGRKRHRHRHHGGGGGGGGVSAQPDPAEPGRAGALREGRGAGAALSSSVPGSAVPQAPAEGAAPGAGLTPVPESPRPYELNTSINCRDEVVQPILPPSAADPSSCASAPPGSAAPPSCPARHRKRRRTSSKSDSSSAATGPGPAAGGRKVTPEKGRAARQQAQTFQTPVGGGAGGMGAPGSAASASCARGGAGTHRRRRQQQQQQRKFQYGNYNKYYGYRNPGWSEDPRVRVLRPEWFRGKAVLDLGCNTGHLTLTLAKNWQPARVTGLDIDGALVHAARQNVRHYLSELAAEEARRRRREGAAEQERGRDLGQERKQEPDRVQDLDRDQEQDHQHEQELDQDHQQDHQHEQELDQDQERDHQHEQELEQDHQQEQKQDHMQDREQEQDREGASLGNQEEEAIQVQQEEKRTGDVAEDSAGSQSRQPAPPAARHPFPISLRICRGPIAAPPVAQPAPSAPGDFPANVTFVQGNYVLPNDELLVSQKPEYDVILCLSMTKWVHLNWGDAGLQRLFKRVYRHLQPGGIFILEPQPWASYGKRKKLTETIYKNYYSIRFKPDQFSSYLTGPEVGFSSYELIGTPKSSSKGFQRPIYLFHKGPSFARK